MMETNDFLRDLFRSLLEGEALKERGRKALSMSRQFLGADYGLLVYANSEQEFIHLETEGLSWRRGSNRSTLEFPSKRRQLRQWYRCRAVLPGEGEEIFERQEKIEGYIDSRGRDRFILHRMFIERFGTILAFPLLVNGEIVGGLALGFAMNVAAESAKRNILAYTVRDIAATLHRTANQELTRLRMERERARLERAMPAMLAARLAAVMMHEIGNRANIGLNGAAAITRRPAFQKLPRIAQEEMWLIKDSFAAIGNWTQSYLRISGLRQEPVEISRTSNPINSAVRDALYSLRHLSYKYQIDTELAAELDRETVFFDHRFITMAIENLIRNALRWSQTGGRILIHTEHNESEVCVQVMDWGEGVDLAIQNHIFEAFFSKSHDGFGLGLTMSRYIVEELHGGRLTLVKTKQPTIFKISLPHPGNSQPGQQPTTADKG